MTPIPVMTTRIYTNFKKDCRCAEGNKLRLLGCGLSRGILLVVDEERDAIDHFANGLDLLRVFVFDFDIELALEALSE